MSLVLHQFRKEFRWLRPRWFVFLVVLAFDFAYNLEWVWPLRSGGAYGISEIVGGVLWLVAWWVALSTPPEDAADAGRAFGWTRPLARRSYWLARLLVWALLIVLPLTLEVGGYLLVMRRPWDEIGLGMLEQLLAGAAMTLWVLPAALLFRGWERYVALVVFAALWEVGYARTLLELAVKHIGANVRYLNFPAMDPLRFVAAAGLVAPLMVLLLVWHQRRSLSLLTRNAALAGMTILTYGLGASDLLRDLSERGEDPDLVARLGAVVQPRIDKDDLGFFPRTEDKEGRTVPWTVSVAADGMPHGMLPLWLVEGATVTQQGRTLPMKSGGPMNLVNPWLINLLASYQPYAGALPPPWPADSLSVDSQAEANRLSAPTLLRPADMDTPVDIDLNMAAMWTRLRELGHAPLKAGARIHAPEAELEILEVRTHVDSLGQPRPRGVTLLLRQSMRSLGTRSVAWPVQPLLAIHAPGKRLLWQRTVSGGTDWRSLRLGWVHMVHEVSFGEVMMPGAGVTEENLGEQQLLWLKPEHLGTSRHRVEIKGVDLGAQARRPDHRPATEAALNQRANPRLEFLANVRQTPPPAADAPLPEAAHYVAAVYAASAAHDRRTETNTFAEPEWPGDDREVAAMLAPYLIRHPELVRKLRLEKPGDLTDEALREALLQARIPGFQRDPAGKMPFYLRTSAVPDKPGEFVHISGDLWPVEVERKDILDAVARMLQTGSDDPMAALLVQQPVSLEKTWKEFPATVGSASLRVLYPAPDYRNKAVAEVTRQYAALRATTVLGETPVLRIIAAKAVLGDAAALDRLLRVVALQDDDHGRDLVQVQSAHHAAFASTITLREVPDFIRHSRDWTADDFRYDAEKMAWVLKAPGPPLPKKP